jgi:hypothetical protein
MTLRRGDVVEVRTAAEILATLDAGGAVAGLPFMGEMIPLCGRRLTVDGTAERLCDTIHWSGSRRIPDTVLLEQARCDGSGHDGCEAECRFLWKEVWLRPVDPAAPLTPAVNDEAARSALLALVSGNTRQPFAGGQPGARYRCQTTELYRASGATSRFPYLHELTSGNVTVGRFLPVIARAAVWETRRKLGRFRNQCFAGTSTPVRRPPLDLKPGEWVRIRSAKEIEETIDLKGGSRGLWFDWEMLQYCGRTFRVKNRIARFIHDDGTLMIFKSAAVKLEGVTCAGDYSVGRWFCPRAIFPFWREDWLERVPAPLSVDD